MVERPLAWLQERQLFAALLMVLIVAPLPLGSNREWAWPVLTMMLCLIGAAWLFGVLRLDWQPSATLRRARWLLLLWAVVLLWQLLQLLPLPLALVAWLSPSAAQIHGAAYAEPPLLVPLSLDGYATWTGVLKTLSYALLFILLLQLIDCRRRVEWLLYAVVYSGLFQAVYGSLMALTRAEHGLFVANQFAMNATGSFINRNHFAGFMELCLALGIGLLLARLSRMPANTWRQRGRSLLQALLGEKGRLRLALAIMVVALVLSHSRMGNSAFFISLMLSGGVALVILLWRRQQGARHGQGWRPLMLLLASLMVIDLMIVGAWFGVDRVVERLENTSAQTETRDEVNEYAWRILADYPLTGVGAGAFYTAILGYQDQRVAGFYDQAHNDYLQFAVELGLPAVIALGALVFFALRAALLAMWRRQSGFYFGVAFGGFMAVSSLLIHSFVDFNLQIPANALYFIVALALSFQSLTLESRRGRQVAAVSAPEEV